MVRGYKQIKCSYGTVDSKNLKSIYLNIQSWVKPKTHEESWNRIVSVFNKNIKTNLIEIIDNDLLNEKFIVDLDLRTSGISVKKRSFMNLEVTLFLKKDIDFKSTELKNSIKNIINYIETESFKKSNYFKFYLTKSSKTKTIDKIESI